jgi:hypothetical protein
MESLIGLLPFALIAVVCPLMMIFMMRGMHGGHNEHERQRGASNAGTEPAVTDGATSARLQAMEEEMTALRRELAAARSPERVGTGRDGRT